jgi:hypothetical protein
LPLEGNHLFHSELGAGAGQNEKRKHLDQLAKKIGISLKRRFLPLEGNHLFHSELGAGAGQNEKRKTMEERENENIYYHWSN